MYPTMASNGDTVREIPIVLHDGTILRKKKEYEKNKRYSEIIIQVNNDLNESKSVWIEPTADNLTIKNSSSSHSDLRNWNDLSSQTFPSKETRKISGNGYTLPKSYAPPVGHSHSSLESLNRKQNFGYISKTQTRPGAIKPLVYQKYHGSARILPTAKDHATYENVYKSESNLKLNNDSSNYDKGKKIPTTTVTGVQRNLNRDETKLVNPFFDENVKQETNPVTTMDPGDDSDNYWLKLTKTIGHETVSQQQLNVQNVATQTAKRRKQKDSCSLM